MVKMVYDSTSPETTALPSQIKAALDNLANEIQNLGGEVTSNVKLVPDATLGIAVVVVTND